MLRTTTIFAKKPEPGAVKTRLAPRLVGAEAASFATAMLDDTVARCVRAEHREFETVLCVAPEDAVPWFVARYPRVARVVPQIGAGLGERLARHAHDELSEGARTLVVIGSDAPHARIESCLEAHERLERGADLVLGLDDGGGYHLVGLRRPCAEIFTRVPMSTPDMAARTVALAREMGLVVAFVEPEFDVDEPADVERLREAFESGRLARERAPRTAAFLTSARA